MTETVQRAKSLCFIFRMRELEELIKIQDELKKVCKLDLKNFKLD